MRITTTAIEGPAILDVEPRQDERGFFARTFCRDEFLAAGLDPTVEQCNVSFNHRAGTLRGMHYQTDPAPEAKLVRCTRGAIMDIIVDVRPDSPTRFQHVAVELTEHNRRSLYVPPHFAHGYLTLTEGAEVSYQVSARYTPGTERGLRWNDPALALPWPVDVQVISEKDAAWPLLTAAHLVGARPGVPT
ncbi:MAG TPA: dTDP-4-dehydrorhamnose 3,5-epimerase [Kineosporiaceae bacterium]